MLLLNTIYNIDALEGLKQIDTEFVDLVITSPPYNLRNKNDKPTDLSNSQTGKWKNYSLAKGYDGYNDALKHEDYVVWQKVVLSECWRCLKKTGAIFYNHKPIIRNGTAILPTQYLPEYVNLRQIVIWERAGGVNFNTRFYLPTYEWIMVLAKEDFELKSKGASGIKDVWKINQTKNSGHPASFSIELPRNILETVKYKDVVCDPFIGIGTTALACKEVGSNYIGFDISEEYCRVAREKLKIC